MKQIITSAFLIICFILNCDGQNFREEFNALLTKKDTVAAEKLLANWKGAKNNDPEFYTAAFNLYVTKSRTEVITVGKNPKGGNVLQLMDQDTNKKEPAGYIYSETYYKPAILKIGFEYIDTGIIKYPSRLDMRFGKIYMLGETQDYESFTKEIIKTIDYSNVSKNKWTWTNNEPTKEDPKEFLLSSIQNYVMQLYNTGDDSLLDNMRRIAETALKYYPDHVESLTNVAITYMVKGEYDKALPLLLKAEKIAPKDYIVLSDIALCYARKKDTKNAIKYYELTAKYGSDEIKESANKELENLKKK